MSGVGSLVRVSPIPSSGRAALVDVGCSLEEDVGDTFEQVAFARGIALTFFSTEEHRLEDESFDGATGAESGASTCNSNVDNPLANQVKKSGGVTSRRMVPSTFFSIADGLGNFPVFAM